MLLKFSKVESRIRKEAGAASFFVPRDMFAFFLLLVASSLMMASSAQSTSAPWFCHGLDCPAFTNVTSTEGLELRVYETYLWSSTQIQGTSLDDATTEGFNRLFAYISGDNEAGQKIDMTSPVLVKTVPGSGPNCVSTFTVSFFVPFTYQTSVGPPKPTSSLVYIETIPSMEVAVNEFGGFAEQKTIIAQAAVEQAAVSNSSQVVNADGENWWYAGYDPPFRLTNRHNEVWIQVAAKA